MNIVDYIIYTTTELCNMTTIPFWRKTKLQTKLAGTHHTPISAAKRESNEENVSLFIEKRGLNRPLTG
jgi:hypothetical protein